MCVCLSFCHSSWSVLPASLASSRVPSIPPLSSLLDVPGRFSKPFQPPTVTSSAYRKPSLPLALVSIPPMPMILDYTHLLLFFSPVAYDSIIIRSIFFLFTAYVPRSYASSFILLFCSLCYNHHTLHFLPFSCL